MAAASSDLYPAGSADSETDLPLTFRASFAAAGRSSECLSTCRMSPCKALMYLRGVIGAFSRMIGCPRLWGEAAVGVEGSDL